MLAYRACFPEGVKLLEELLIKTSQNLADKRIKDLEIFEKCETITKNWTGFFFCQPIPTSVELNFVEATL
jgi:hypothetical protein